MAKEKKEKKPNPIKKFFEEFKKFITRGNVLDMAVGVIVGGAFTAIVNGVSNYVLKPLINWLLAIITKGQGLAGAVTPLRPVYIFDEATGKSILDLANSIYIDWGSLIIAIINFFITAFVLFLIVKTMNTIAENNKKFIAEAKSDKTKAIKAIRKEQKVSRKQAKAIYAQQVAEAEAAAAAEAKAKEEAEKAAAEEAARIAEEKANAPTVLLGEIRALLERIAPPLPEEETKEGEENAENAEATEEAAATEATEEKAEA
ncbi:MAG: large conductance mechanosensitive channel protein MscL [Clostridia bacterium]|nr:large conductance mechanosensitive channel protein MscL [Clostridia bacterium]